MLSKIKAIISILFFKINVYYIFQGPLYNVKAILVFKPIHFYNSQLPLSVGLYFISKLVNCLEIIEYVCLIIHFFHIISSTKIINLLIIFVIIIFS